MINPGTPQSIVEANLTHPVKLAQSTMAPKKAPKREVEIGEGRGEGEEKGAGGEGGEGGGGGGEGGLENGWTVTNPTRNASNMNVKNMTLRYTLKISKAFNGGIKCP